MIDRRTFLAGTGAVLLAAPLAAEAQPTAKTPRIALLDSSSEGTRTHLWEAFRQGLRELGYVEGQNLRSNPDGQTEGTSAYLPSPPS